MSVALTVTGNTYNYPQVADENWGTDATNWAQAVTNGMLQKSGGAFTLTAEVDFGSAFGLKSLYISSRTSSSAATGVVRLANTESVAWRNAANSADLALSVNASNILQFNGASFVDAATTQTLTNKTLTAPVIATIVNTGTLTLPTSTDTLVGRATTDTLTNKSISGASNTLSNIGDPSLVTSYIKADGTRGLSADWVAGFSISATSFVPTSLTTPTNGLYLGAANRPAISAASTIVADWQTSAFTCRVPVIMLGASSTTQTSFTNNFLTASMLLAGGNAIGTGGSLVMYGSSHATKANVTEHYNTNVLSMYITAAQSVVVGPGSLATTATDGFLYISKCAGTPTGAPTAQTGFVPIVFDTTNNKIWVFNGTWKGVVVA